MNSQSNRRQPSRSKSVKAKCHHYQIGEEAYEIDIINSPSNNDASSVQAAASLKRFDGAFVRRSDGAWTYAVVYQVVSSNDKDGRIMPYLNFVVCINGSTKKIGMNHWSSRIRTLPKCDDDVMTSSNNIEREDTSLDVTPTTEEKRSALKKGCDFHPQRRMSAPLLTTSFIYKTIMDELESSARNDKKSTSLTRSTSLVGLESLELMKEDDEEVENKQLKRVASSTSMGTKDRISAILMELNDQSGERDTENKQCAKKSFAFLFETLIDESSKKTGSSSSSCASGASKSFDGKWGLGSEEKKKGSGGGRLTSSVLFKQAWTTINRCV